jgi:hypothetical protein
MLARWLQVASLTLLLRAVTDAAVVVIANDITVSITFPLAEPESEARPVGGILTFASQITPSSHAEWIGVNDYRKKDEPLYPATSLLAEDTIKIPPSLRER